MTEPPDAERGDQSRDKNAGVFRDSLPTRVSRFTSFRLGLIGRRSVASVVAIASLILVGVSLLPLRQYREQSGAIEQKQQELSALEELRAELQTKLDRAKNPKEIERIARKQMSYVSEGDEIFRVVVPSDIVDLPRAWYLPGVKYLITGKID